MIMGIKPNGISFYDLERVKIPLFKLIERAYILSIPHYC